MNNFSKYAWDLYKKSADGKKALGLSVEEHASQILGLSVDDVFSYNAAARCTEGSSAGSVGINGHKFVLAHAEMLPSPKSSFGQACEFFEAIADEGLKIQDEFPDEKYPVEISFNYGERPSYSLIYTNIHWVSAGLHLAFPEFFAPFFFGRSFDFFTRICHQFGILIPELPGKLKKRDRALYYLAINAELQRFRKANGLNPQEFNAFLYDFAVRDQEQRAPKQKKTPAASRVWFVIGGTGGAMDHEYVEQVDKDSVGIWQGNIDTRPGDIVVMYMASPKKAIHSIWRAQTFGFIDPFFYYYSAMRVGKPIKIPEIKFSEIAAHPKFKNTPAIRARFQGRSGTELTVQEYKAICAMAKKKGFDISKLPKAPEPIKLPTVKTRNERDVETKLLEPLLAKLGFESEDWERQVSLKVGRRERVIPDYALLPERSGKSVSAKAMIEAKFNIVSEKERNDAFDQARSYARLLGVSRMGIVARQGIWIYLTSDGKFDKARGEAFTWADIKKPQRFARLLDLIGKDSLLRM